MSNQRASGSETMGEFSQFHPRRHVPSNPIIPCANPASPSPASPSSTSDNGDDFCSNYAHRRLPSLMLGLGASASKNRPLMCCILAGRTGRCHARAGMDLLSSGMEEGIDTQKINLKADSRATHRFICDAHKSFIEAAISSWETGSGEEVDTETTSSSSQTSGQNGGLDWSLMGIKTLRRYLIRFGINGHDGAPREELIKVVSGHFSTINVATRHKNIIAEEFIELNRRNNELLEWGGD